MTEPTTRLLRDAENYLSALHGSVARHDNLAANYGCAGCELRDKIAAELRAAAPAGPAPATERTALRERIAEALLDHLSRTADIRPGRTGELAFMPEITDAERMRIAEHLAAVLPAPTDQTAGPLATDPALLLRVAGHLTRSADQLWPDGDSVMHADAAQLRRLAGEALPSSTAPLAAGLPLVKGHCPACGTAGLFLGHGGYVTCSRIDCPEPDAASTVLEQPTSVARPGQLETEA